MRLTKISEVNLSAFVYRLFHEDFSSIIGITTVSLFIPYYANDILSTTNPSDLLPDYFPKRVMIYCQYAFLGSNKEIQTALMSTGYRHDVTM